jgi:hypothetical protein
MYGSYDENAFGNFSFQNVRLSSQISPAQVPYEKFFLISSFARRKQVELTVLEFEKVNKGVTEYYDVEIWFV